ncbi:1501_t:CDS:2, partial [Acaulospora morrowiae]
NRAYQAKSGLQECHANGAILEYWCDQLIVRYQKWKNKTHDIQQTIINLQNNPLANSLNMATTSRQHIYQTIQTSLAHIPNYIGQEPLNDYCNKIQQAISFADTMIIDANHANANTFTDAHKADIYKLKMARKYVPVPAQHPVVTNIDTPDCFRAWLRHKYHELTKPKKVNNVYQSEPENSDDEEVMILENDESKEEEGEEEESISNNEPQNCFNEVFLESLKHMISELIPHCPKKILIEARIFLNNLFIKMKDQFDSYYGEKYTVKERNKDQTPNSSSHKEMNRDYELISPSEKLDNSITLNHAIKVYQGAQIRQNWPNPFEIDFLDIKEPNDVTTISCRI